MDYEKAYKEAIEKIKNGLQPLSDGTKISGVTRAFLEEVFPELKEPEDERIRKALITFFQRFPYDSIEQAGTNAKEAIAWLEKQGEQKPINPNAIKDLERAILAAHPTFKQKPTWSGEDERMVEEILDAIEATEYEMAFNMSDVRQWLKNLKQRLS